MDNLEAKAQELLDANKAKTLDEAKTIIANAISEVTKVADLKLEELQKTWTVKFDEMDKALLEAKSEANRMKMDAKDKAPVSFNQAFATAMDENYQTDSYVGLSGSFILSLAAGEVDFYMALKPSITTAYREQLIVCVQCW